MVALMKMPSETSTENWAERRMFPRREFHATVRGNRLDHTIEARQMPRLNLMLRDLSLGGLSAICDHPVQRGEHLSVFFPQTGLNRGWDAFGRVVRCEPSSMGYRIALEFDSLPAA